jgi:thiol-disulfide isomerase/thioredoxin
MARQHPERDTRRNMATDLGKGGRNKPNARARAAALREQQRKREARRRMLTIGGAIVAVLAVVAVMVIVYATKSDKKNAATRQPAPASIVQQVTTVPAAAFDKVGIGEIVKAPSKITGPPLVFDGKPGVFFYGAEYCPFCAAERWGVVVALSRFGTWSSLDTTTSSSQDQFPNTPTFSFLNAKFSSPYIGFQSVETQTNQLKNGNYQTLQIPTAAQAALVSKYNSSGSIPFIDFGNKFLIQGATYNNSVLTGKSLDEIAAAVSDPTSDIGKSILGVANTMTASICETTGGKPGAVCNTADMKKLRSELNNQKS